MIERYSRPQMKAIWTEQNKFQAFLDVEIANAEAIHQKGVLSAEELKKIQTNASFSLDRIRELEGETRHDVIAFTRAVSETLGEERKFIHYGLTSTDVVDTANGILLKKANRIIREDIVKLMEVLKLRAYEFQTTYTIGRTHGMHAEITIFGLKWALWYDEMSRNLTRFDRASKDVEVGKISGAVGNYAFTDPDIEAYICNKLGLGIPNISTQTLQRDRHAHYISTLVIIGSTLEKIATEIRNLQRTEVGEVQEYFEKSQKGSSAMPHKHNPISSENICGLARVLRGYLTPIYENISLWHERDISHSSVERIIFPDATILADYMLSKMNYILETLLVFPDKMLENIDKTNGAIFSQRVLSALIDQGMSREDAYDLTQVLAEKSYAENNDFRDVIRNDDTISRYIDKDHVEKLFKLDFYGKNVQSIFQKVFK